MVRPTPDYMLALTDRRLACWLTGWRHLPCLLRAVFYMTCRIFRKRPRVCGDIHRLSPFEFQKQIAASYAPFESCVPRFVAALLSAGMLLLPYPKNGSIMLGLAIASASMTLLPNCSKVESSVFHPQV